MHALTSAKSFKCFYTIFQLFHRRSLSLLRTFSDLGMPAYHLSHLEQALWLPSSLAMAWEELQIVLLWVKERGFFPASNTVVDSQNQKTIPRSLFYASAAKNSSREFDF